MSDLKLDGEDREYGSGLFVDMVPKTCWFTNVRSCVTPTSWDRLRKLVYSRANYRCEACGTPGRMEAHERWEFLDGPPRTQRLRRLIALCAMCHTTTHFGLAQIRGLADQARAHLAKVQKLTPAEVDAHINSAGRRWEMQSQHVWALDLSILTNAGFDIVRPAAAVQRARQAAERLHEVRRREGRL